MSIEALKSALPDYAKDLKLNLGAVLSQPVLTEQQKAAFQSLRLSERARDNHNVRRE